MKIRKDYVTNSSSSSFVCFGKAKDDIPLSAEDVKKLEGSNDIENMEEHEFWEEKLQDTLLDFTSMGDCDCYYIGMTMSTIFSKLGDCKVSEVESKVAEEFNRVFGTKFTAADMEYIEEAYYN
jgi:hypothetical protein